MNLWSFIANQFHTNAFLNGAVITGALLALVAPFRSLPKKLLQYAWGKVFVTISVDSSSEIYWWLNKVIQDMPYERHHRSHYLMGRILVKNMDGSMEESNESIFNNQNIDNVASNLQSKRVLDCVFSPAEGGYWFRFKKKWMYLHFEIMKDNSGLQQRPLYRLNIGYFGSKEGWIKQLLQEAQLHLDNEVNQKVLMYTHNSYNWSKSNDLNTKTMNSVTLKESLMESIIDDIKKFQQSESKYRDIGIPFHRTLLFSGPPGTGKTSTIMALANYFKLSVFYLNLVTITSERLPLLIQEVQNRSLLVIEDMGSIYNQEEIIVKQSSLEMGPPQFSVLLNCLDGFLSKYGSLTILTTNHLDRLSPLLNRPGRIDARYDFSLADSEQVRKMCLRYFKYHLNWEQEQRANISNAIAQQYVTSKWSLSPAHIQQILLSDKGVSPEDTYQYFCVEAVKRFEEETVRDSK